MYNFPLYNDKPDQASPSSKQGSVPEGPSSGAVPGPALTNLCLLVDVTASKLKRVGRYNLGRVVGRGAFGVVRLGQNTQTGVTAVVHHVLAHSLALGSQETTLVADGCTQEPCCTSKGNTCVSELFALPQNVLSCSGAAFLTVRHHFHDQNLGLPCKGSGPFILYPRPMMLAAYIHCLIGTSMDAYILVQLAWCKRCQAAVCKHQS